MTRTSIIGLALAVAATAIPQTAFAEDVVLKGPVSDVFGHRVVMESASKKFLINFGPKIKDLSALKVGDTVSVEGDLTNSGEVRAFNVTLADGKKIEVAKDKTSWKEWLMGDNDDADKLFTADDAKKLATDKGYTLSGNIAADKKHFVASATKDGKPVEVELHRDGSVKEVPMFGPAEAKTNIASKGYEVFSDLIPVRKHFEALGEKGADFFEVHAHRDGEVKEARKVDKTDPKWGSKIL